MICMIHTDTLTFCAGWLVAVDAEGKKEAVDLEQTQAQLVWHLNVSGCDAVCELCAGWQMVSSTWGMALCVWLRPPLRYCGDQSGQDALGQDAVVLSRQWVQLPLSHTG